MKEAMWRQCGIFLKVYIILKWTIKDSAFVKQEQTTIKWEQKRKEKT